MDLLDYIPEFKKHRATNYPLTPPDVAHRHKQANKQKLRETVDPSRKNNSKGSKTVTFT